MLPVYFNTLDADDNGTAIDFMLNRGLSFADIRARFGAPAAASRDFQGPLERGDAGSRAGLARWSRHPEGDARSLPSPDPPRPAAAASSSPIATEIAGSRGFEIGPPGRPETLRERRNPRAVRRPRRIRRRPGGPRHHRGRRRRPQPGPDRRMPRQPGISLHRRGALAKPARTDWPRGKRPSQRQDRRPRTGRRRGRRVSGGDPARQAEGPAPRHVRETPARRRTPTGTTSSTPIKKAEKHPAKGGKRKGPGGLSSTPHTSRARRRDHPTCAAKSSLKSAANRRNPALF